MGDHPGNSRNLRTRVVTRGVGDSLGAGMTNPHDPTDWQNVNLVALSPRGREIAQRIAAQARYAATADEAWNTTPLARSSLVKIDRALGAAAISCIAAALIGALT
jgi:hypothetical protein